MTRKTTLRRYTQLPYAIEYLSTGKITLLSPDSWDDQNDSYFMQLYKERKSYKSLLAICFSLSTPTYHHWKVFGHSTSGILLTFDKDSFSRVIKRSTHAKDIIQRGVQYLQLKDCDPLNFNKDDLPFLKRYGFRHEREYRLIYQSYQPKATLNIPVPLACVTGITLNPWISISAFRAAKETLKTIIGNHKIQIRRSTLTKNEEWCAFGDSITHRD